MRAMLDEKFSSYKQEKLKRKLPADVQLAQNAKELELKRRLLDNMERMDRQYSEAMAKMSANMDKPTNSIADGCSLLCGLLLPQQTMFGGHQQNMYPPMHSMYTGHQSQCTIPNRERLVDTNRQKVNTQVILNQVMRRRRMTPFSRTPHSHHLALSNSQ